MVIYPLIIFIYIAKLTTTSFINQEDFKNNLNSKLNLFLNEYNISNNNDNAFLEMKKIIERNIEERPNNNETENEEENENEDDENNPLVNILKYLFEQLHANMRTNITDESYEKLKELFNLFIDKRIKRFNINPQCFNLINASYDAIKDEKDLPRKEFLNEVLLNIFINKNDFISYDKCLQNSELFRTLTKGKESFKYHPLYFFSLANKLDNNSNITEMKKSTLFEKNYFYYGICLIEAEKKEKESFCNENDYLTLIQIILNIGYSINDTTFETFSLKNKNDYFSNKEIFIDLIPLLILLIPLIIKIILYVCKNRIIKKQKKGTIIPLNKDNNTLESSDEDNDLIIEPFESSKKQNKEENEYQIYIPNLYKLLNDMFNFKKNIKELFNLNDKVFNNNIGLSYSNALIGISFFLTIIGQTYFALYNLPIKNFGIWSFYNSISQILYIPIFIGLRYSPRVVFSCSGYTLAYKYLSFIEKKPGYHFVKFILLQIYKYFLLIVILLFTKYSLYHLKIFIADNVPSWEIFLRKVLQKPESKAKIFLNFITFKIFDFKMDHDRLSQDIFSYFWIPLNEIFFFFFGTIIIALGYSFKIRIDYAIIALFLILYSGKIIYYYVYYYNKEEIYTTLYYYMFEYGKLMLNPLFNLPYFLIGMYFGLINYSIQRGINESDRNSDYSRIYNIKKNKKNEDKDKDKEKLALLDFKMSKSNTNDYDNGDVRNSINIDNEDEEDSNKSERLSKDVELIKLENKPDIYKATKSKSTGHIKTNLPKMNNYKGVFGEDSRSADSILSEDGVSTDSINPSINSLEEMPFLAVPIKIKSAMRKTIKSGIHIFFLTLFFIIICMFTSAHFIFISKYADISFSDKEQNKDEFMKRLTLEEVIPNKTLNFLYLIDIELVIIFSQFILFYLYMRGHETIINGFFSHIYWSFFNRIYFSSILVMNTIILYNFYESDNIIKLNSYTVYLYSFVNIVIIFVIMIICYIYLEFPLKKLFKYYIRKYEINEENEDEEDEDENE